MTVIFDTIAENLATDGYSVTDQFLSQKETDSILATSSFQAGIESFKKAGIGKDKSHQINEQIRGDYIQWLDKNNPAPAVGVYLTRITGLISFLNQSLYLSLKDFEAHLTVYPAGSYYKRHLDQFRKDDHRKLSVICYLNKNWKEENGGQLRMHLASGSIDILPVEGRLVCFRSDLIEHEVLPATRDRLSLTGWMLDQFSDLRHL